MNGMDVVDSESDQEMGESIDKEVKRQGFYEAFPYKLQAVI